MEAFTLHGLTVGFGEQSKLLEFGHTYVEENGNYLWLSDGELLDMAMEFAAHAEKNGWDKAAEKWFNFAEKVEEKIRQEWTDLNDRLAAGGDWLKED